MYVYTMYIRYECIISLSAKNYISNGINGTYNFLVNKVALLEGDYCIANDFSKLHLGEKLPLNSGILHPHIFTLILSFEQGK